MGDHGDLSDGIELGARIISERVEIKSIDGFDYEFYDKLRKL